MKHSKSHSTSIQTIVGLRFIIDKHEVITLEKLGEDNYSSIYSCVDTTGAIHILKIIQTSDREFLSSSLRGIVIHSNLANHYNILRLEEYSASDMSIQVLMEFCDDSLINEMAKVEGRGFSTEKIAEIFSSILAAARFIHSQNPPIIHRGINPKNILCQKGVWKLCYFRSATTRVYHTDNDNDRRLAFDDISQNTNPIYRAPEMVDLYRGQTIDVKADIWSLGCLLYKICTLKDAFPEGKSLPILNGKYTWDQPWPVDEYFKNIVARCLNPNPEVRPTAAELDDQLRAHFKIGPTPDPTEKAVRMTQKIHHSDNEPQQQALVSSALHSYSTRINQFQIGTPIVQIKHTSQPRPHQAQHVQLDYYSYTKALLHVLPPDDELSDESDIEVIEEKKEIGENENNNDEKFNKELNELNLDAEEEIEEEEEIQENMQSKKKRRRPSVIQLSTTIENLIEFGDEPAASVKNAVNKFNIEDSKHNSNGHSHHHHKNIDNTFNTSNGHETDNKNNNNPFNSIDNRNDHDSLDIMNKDHGVYKTMIDNDHNSLDIMSKNHHSVFNIMDDTKNHNNFNTMNNSNNYNAFNTTNNNNGQNTFNTSNDNNHNIFNTANSSSAVNNNVFNTMNVNNSNSSNSAFSSTMNSNSNNNNKCNTNQNLNNNEIFKAFDNYNKTKNLRNDILSLDTSNSQSSSHNPFNNLNNDSNHQINMGNKVSFSTGNINQIHTNNDMLDSSDSIDDLFKNATPANTPDYKTMYLTNPDQLKLTLLKLDNLSLSTALYNFMSTDDTSYYILGLARESGINGTRILCHIPALSPTSMNNYLQQRKQFLINFPMFEGNFSLYDFTQQNKGKPPPTPGTPPCSVDVAIQLLKVLDLFLKAFAEHKGAMILVEDGYDAFQTLSYVIAKLRFFKIQQGFVDSSIIPLYNNLHRRMLDAFTKAQLNMNFPSEPFNFNDEQIVKKLRAPKHRDIYEQTQQNGH